MRIGSFLLWFKLGRPIEEMLEPQRIAKFLHVEVPIRMAERIRWIREIQGWQSIQELRDIEENSVNINHP